MSIGANVVGLLDQCAALNRDLYKARAALINLFYEVGYLPNLDELRAELRQAYEEAGRVIVELRQDHE